MAHRKILSGGLRGGGHYGQVPVATVVTNVETALRIYLTMMVSLRSL
jgi:hypothetical protein